MFPEDARPESAPSVGSFKTKLKTSFSAWTFGLLSEFTSVCCIYNSASYIYFIFQQQSQKL